MGSVTELDLGLSHHPPVRGISSRNLEFIQIRITILLSEELGIFEFHLVFALPSEFRSLLGVPPNFHNWDAALFRSFYFPIHNLRRFFHEVEPFVDLDLVMWDYKILVG